MKQLPVFLLLLFCCSCASRKKIYYSVNNPLQLELKAVAPNVQFYTDASNEGKFLRFVLINHSGSAVTLPGINSGDLNIRGKRRNGAGTLNFRYPAAIFAKLDGMKLMAGDSVELFTATLEDLFSPQSRLGAWAGKNGKDVAAPVFKASGNAGFYGDIFMTVTVGEVTVRSKNVRFYIGKKAAPTEITKKAVLSIRTDAVNYVAGGDNGQPVAFMVKNLTGYDLSFFSDPGTVRFNLYGYSRNRTAVMQLEFKRGDAGKLLIRPLIVKPGEEKEIFEARLYELLYTKDSSGLPFFWTWKKPKDAISPVIYNDGKYTPGVELWFGIVIDGREYLSSPLYLPVVYARK